MTKNILHAIKKFLRIGLVAGVVTSGSINASAQESMTELCSTSCTNQLNVSLDASGYALIDPISICEDTYKEECFPFLDKIVVEISGSNSVDQDVTINNHTVSTFSARVDRTFVGQKVKYSLLKYYSNGTVYKSIGTIMVEDVMLPTITCSDLTINIADNTHPYELAKSFNNSLPIASDNCGFTTLTFQDTEQDFECKNSDFLKKIKRVWAATDDSGNQKTVIQNIFIKKADASEIEFPMDIELNNSPILSLSNSDMKKGNTDFPTLHGVKIDDNGLGNYTSSYEDKKVHIRGDHFKILRNWTVVDWCTNEILTHTQTINELDKKVALK